MSMLEKHKILHGLPKVGQKIKFVKPAFSWFINVVEDSKKLVTGQEYTVRKTQLNSSSTYVWLEEFPNVFDPNDPNDGRDQPFFSMNSFEWDLPEIDLCDLIGFNVRDLGTLNRVYRWGITIGDVIWFEGNPMLVANYDENDIATSTTLETKL